MAGERGKQYKHFESIQHNWVQFIRSLDAKAGFDWYSTWTFRDDTHPESAVKALRRLHHIINRRVYGVRYWKRNAALGRDVYGISSVVCIERQQRGVLHFHSLDAGTRGFRRLDAMDIWYKMAGIARVYPFERNGGAEKYVAKYIMKGKPWESRGGGELYLFGSFNSDRCPTWPRSNEGGKSGALPLSAAIKSGARETFDPAHTEKGGHL